MANKKLLESDTFAEVFNTALWNGMNNPIDYIKIDDENWFEVCEALVAEWQQIV